MANNATLDPSVVRFADRLKAATAQMHVEAERGGAVALLLRGALSREVYALFLANLLPTYEAIERGLLQWRGLPALQPIAHSSVFRAKMLRADLIALAGPEWTKRLKLLGAGRDYAGRIEEITRDDPTLLLAHAYVRYLGDLNGGQTLAKRLAVSLALGPEALGFYRFDLITDIAAFRRTYRLGFDQAGLTPTQEDNVITEARLAFRLNIAISEAVIEVNI